MLLDWSFDRLEVMAHVDTEIFNAAYGLLPSESMLRVVDLWHIRSEVAPAWPDFELLFLIEYRFLSASLSAFLRS